jgi:hypothetical protein
MGASATAAQGTKMSRALEPNLLDMAAAVETFYPLAPEAGRVCWLEAAVGRFQIVGADENGDDVVVSDPPGRFQALVLPRAVTKVQARHDGPARPPFTLKCASTPSKDPEHAEGAKAVKAKAVNAARDVVEGGYAVRGPLAADKYLQIYEFGRKDWTKESPGTRSGDLRTELARLAGLDSFGEEPVVVFLGIAGLAKILVADKDGKARPDRDNLAPEEAVWVAYLEDDGRSFETTVDVQFNRASRIKFDQFEPGAAQLGAAASLRTVGARPMVRAGFKRIPLTLPMSMQVAFTRQGGQYGFRQWQKSLRVRRWPFDMSVAAFVPATEVTLNTHALTPADGYPLDGDVDFNVIVQEARRRQVFAAFRLGWPGVRAATEDAPAGWKTQKTAWIPDLVVGIGIPPTRATAAYVGLSLPVPRVPRLHLTAGSTFLWQSRLRQEPCYDFRSGQLVRSTTDLLSVGCKVPLTSKRHDIVKGSTPVGEFVFGVIVDLFTWP